MAWKYTPRFACQAVRAITQPARVVLVQEETDVFGNPIDQVSPRVQRIRDLEAAKNARGYPLRGMSQTQAILNAHAPRMQPVARKPIDCNETIKRMAAKLNKDIENDS